jgi:hypothetical protein
MKSPYLWIGLIISLCAVNVLNDLSNSSAKSGSYLVPPPEYIEFFHFGFRESVADSFWLRWIQDSDTCQTYLTPLVIVGDAENASQALQTDLVTIPRHKICDHSWGFKMLDAVTKLAPKFEMPYLAGASALAILVEDYAGATVIYERGLHEYPGNWQLLYRAAFHYQFNLKDLPRAAELLLRAADLGAPVWIRSLASRLYSSVGQLELGLSVLMSYRKTLDFQNQEGIRAVDRRIADLKAQLNRKRPQDVGN